MTKLAIVPIERRNVLGPKSRTYYLFEPWCEIEDIDLEDLLSVRVRMGCNCGNGNVQEMPLFASEQDIFSGKVSPSWKGRYGSPK